jgi:SpoVK/Ycf46/Vps4 family AAA+-type ATPase
VNALLAGPSGTGKTMAAQVIAHELGLELFAIDLSGVVSKYIGETEKNLDAIFRAAEGTDAVLLFDEADALFGKRSEVRDSHDRYANLEVSYLLQRMEAHDGVAILATNLRQNLDEAFLRRLAFTIRFPFPEEEERRRIWSMVWPATVPLDADIDVILLASRYKFSGGNIRNVAVGAAFLAASAGRSVSMADVLAAVDREYEKLGGSSVSGSSLRVVATSR